VKIPARNRTGEFHGLRQAAAVGFISQVFIVVRRTVINEVKPFIRDDRLLH